MNDINAAPGSIAITLWRILLRIAILVNSYCALSYVIAALANDIRCISAPLRIRVGARHQKFVLVPSQSQTLIVNYDKKESNLA